MIQFLHMILQTMFRHLKKSKTIQICIHMRDTHTISDMHGRGKHTGWWWCRIKTYQRLLLQYISNTPYKQCLFRPFATRHSMHHCVCGSSQVVSIYVYGVVAICAIAYVQSAGTVPSSYPSPPTFAQRHPVYAVPLQTHTQRHSHLSAVARRIQARVLLARARAQYTILCCNPLKRIFFCGCVSVSACLSPHIRRTVASISSVCAGRVL